MSNNKFNDTVTLALFAVGLVGAVYLLAYAKSVHAMTGHYCEDSHQNIQFVQDGRPYTGYTTKCQDDIGQDNLLDHPNLVLELDKINALSAQAQEGIADGFGGRGNINGNITGVDNNVSSGSSSTSSARVNNSNTTNSSNTNINHNSNSNNISTVHIRGH